MDDRKPRQDTVDVPPLISTIVLNWNRRDLLERTLNRYLATVSVPHEMIIVDNASTDGSRELIAAFALDGPSRQALLLEENLGGEAINLAVDQCRAPFVFVCENDILLRPGWDRVLLEKLRVFPGLGQISPFRAGVSPTHEWTVNGLTVLVAETNVTTLCMCPREVYERGARWTSHAKGTVRLPADSTFSRRVKELGYVVAWNDEPLADAPGWSIAEYASRLQYYLDTEAAKPGGLAAFERRLRDGGHELVQDEAGRWSIVPLANGTG